jgi:galactose mutarotase-like enzyme
MMATARLGAVGEFRAIVLENPNLQATIIPELGARVWNLRDRIRGREWIWHRDDVALARAPVGAAYDDAWAGGWEELFPNDAPASFEGRVLPDHGEWWASSWEVDERTEGEVAVLRLSTELSIIRAACTKEFRLAADASEISIAYRIRSLETQPVHFLFKQHLPVRITPGCRLALPGGKISCVDPSFGTRATGDGEFAWPFAEGSGGKADLRRIPPRGSREREFFYARDVPEPWCGVDDPESDASLRLRFELPKLPYVWFFLAYGGWRGLYTAVIEPCTNMPKDLAEAARLGQSALLEPGEEFSTTVSVALTGLRDAQ